MNYLHYQVDAGPQNSVVVTVNEVANVKLLDALNYYKYRAGKKYESTDGGDGMTSPVQLKPTYKAKWHVVVDLGGKAGEVRATVDVEKI